MRFIIHLTIFSHSSRNYDVLLTFVIKRMTFIITFLIAKDTKACFLCMMFFIHVRAGVLNSFYTNFDGFMKNIIHFLCKVNK